MKGAPILLLVALLGCRPTPEAPEELSDISAFYFREHLDADDPSAGLAATHLLALMHDVDYTATASADRAFALEDLTDSDVIAVQRPDVPIADCVEIAVTAMSDHPIELHAALFVERDQLPAQTATERYNRTFIDGDPACFAAGDCRRLATSNDIRRANLLYTIDYVMPKEARWLDMVDSQGAPLDRRAMTARSWLDRSWTAENGETELTQSYSVEVWIEADDGRTLRFEALYTDMHIPGVTDEGIIRNTARSGIDDGFDTNEAAIDALFGR